MKGMHELREMLCEEIEKISRRGDLSAGSLETVHKLTDTVKNIDKIMMLEGEDGYSERRKRDSMGRYSRDGGEMDDRGMHHDRTRYSRADGKDKMLHELGEMMEDADGEQRRVLERAMREIRNI